MKSFKSSILALFLIGMLNPVFAEVLVFVSFSMPDASLKTWMHDAHTIYAPVIIRGLINNSFKETTSAIYRLVKEQSGGMQIDPLLFERFQIKKVPAVVVTESTACLSNQSCLLNYDVFYGDVTLQYALKEIAKKEDRLSLIAESALHTLKERKNA